LGKLSKPWKIWFWIVEKEVEKEVVGVVEALSDRRMLIQS